MLSLSGQAIFGCCLHSEIVQVVAISYDIFANALNVKDCVDSHTQYILIIKPSPCGDCIIKNRKTLHDVYIHENHCF
jgi:hypothetical protein